MYVYIYIYIYIYSRSGRGLDILYLCCFFMFSRSCSVLFMLFLLLFLCVCLVYLSCCIYNRKNNIKTLEKHGNPRKKHFKKKHYVFELCAVGFPFAGLAFKGYGLPLEVLNLKTALGLQLSRMSYAETGDRGQKPGAWGR